MEERFNSLSDQRLQDDTDKAVTDMRKEHADFKLHEKAVVKLMDVISPAKGISQKEYLNRLYKLAKVEAGENARKLEKKALNRGDAPGRLASNGGEDSVNKTVSENYRPTRREAIMAAMQEIEAGDDKD